MRSRTPLVLRGLVLSLSRALSSVANAYRSWREVRAGAAELYSMSDRNLKDIGIGRCQIERMVREKSHLIRDQATYR
jgi:uncharacterized protein YjiS (DUF1127 family)